MDVRRFVDDRAPAWRRLEALLDRAENGRLRGLDPDEVRELARGYRQASADLVLLRGLDVGAQVSSWLEWLVARAHALLYAQDRLFRWREALATVGRLASTVRSERAVVLLSASMLLVPALLAGVATFVEPSIIDTLLPPDYARFYGRAHDDLRLERFGVMGLDGSAAFGSTLWIHNLRVALTVWAGGVTGGLWTTHALATNGALLGATGGHAALVGEGVEFWSLILVHGVPEIFALVLSGAAGLRIARGMWVSNRRPFGTRLRDAARASAVLMGPVVPLLGLAAMLESTVTPSALTPGAKLVIAAVEAAVLAAAFVGGGGRGVRGDGSAGGGG